jgi:hypothetical protein
MAYGALEAESIHPASNRESDFLNTGRASSDSMLGFGRFGGIVARLGVGSNAQCLI